MNAGYRYISFDTDINQFAPQVSTTAQINQLRNQNLVSRLQAKSLTERDYHNFNADASYKWMNNGFVRNTTQIGFYQRILNSRATQIVPGSQAAVLQSPINIYTGQISSPLRDTFPPIAFAPQTRDTVWNSFVQNRTSLANNRLNVTLGFNYGQNDRQSVRFAKAESFRMRQSFSMPRRSSPSTRVIRQTLIQLILMLKMRREIGEFSIRLSAKVLKSERNTIC